MSKKLKVIQLNIAMHERDGPFYTALCDDGTMWVLGDISDGWQPLPEVKEIDKE